MPRLEKGSQEARDYMKSIREKRTTTSAINYETAQGKKTQKNIVINLDKEVDTLPNGERITKTTSKRKVEKPSSPIEEPIEITEENVVIEPTQQAPKKGRRQKYATEEERKKAKLEQTLASNKRKREERKQAKVQGEGVVKDFIQGAKNIGRKIGSTTRNVASATKSKLETGFETLKDVAQNVIRDVTDYGTTVIKGREDYPPKVREILSKYGDEIVDGLTIMRTPVPSVLTGALSLFSAGEFGSRMKNAFDTLFHLFLEIRTKSGKRLSVEKNEVINMDVSPKKRSQTQSKSVSSNIPVGLTINEMMNKTKEYQGKKFFRYSASSNNCQDFIVSIFKSNGIGDEEDIKFIKQDTEQLFKNLPELRKFANTVTDIGGRFNVAITGKGLGTSYVVQSVIFDKLKHPSVLNAKKWLNENGYKAPAVDRSSEYFRFRQIDPKEAEDKGFTEYRTIELGDSGIKLILIYKKRISRKKISGKGIMPYCEMCGCSMEPKMAGGKIKISSKVSGAFKKLGSDVKKGFEKEIVQPIKKDFQAEFVQPIEDRFINPSDDYITSKKGGLATDLVKFGIPALSGAILGGLATTATGGNPVAGVAGSALGSKLGSIAAKKVQKATGTGLVKKGRFVKGSQEARDHMKMIRDMKNK